MKRRRVSALIAISLGQPLRLLVLAALGTACAQENARSQPYELRQHLDAQVERARDTAERFKRLEGNSKLKLFDGALLTAHAEEIRDEMLAADSRIRVWPGADRAGRAFAHSQFDLGLLECLRVLADHPTDPYAAYLAGLCQIELADWDGAAKFFAIAAEAEPASRSAPLLADFVRRLAGRASPIDGEAVVLALDAAITAFEPAPDQEDTGVAALNAAFEVPAVLRDAVLYKFEAEALSVRGPLAVDFERLIDASRKAGDPLLLYAKLQTLLDEDVHEVDLTVSQRREMNAIDFLNRYFGNSAAFRDPASEFFDDVRALANADPDEGIWLLFQIAYKEPDGFQYEPLSRAERELLTAAAAAGRLTEHFRRREALDTQALREAGFPFASRIAENRASGLAFLRNVVAYRGPATVQRAARDGDFELARQMVSILKALSERLLTPSVDAGGGIEFLVRCAYRRALADVALESLPLSTDEWLAWQTLRRDADVSVALARNSYDSRIPELLPSPRINAAYRRLLDGEFAEWEVRRARARAASDIYLEYLPDRIAAAHDAERSKTSLRYLFEAGGLQFEAAKPALRSLADQQLGDDLLYALIWSVGELRDAHFMRRLVDLLSDPRPWVPVMAEEALEKITGERHGRDPAAWAKCLPASDAGP